MGKLETIRTNQNERQNKRELKKIKKMKSKRRRSPGFRAFVISLKLFVVLMFAAVIAVGMWIEKQIDSESAFGDDLVAFSRRLSDTGGTGVTPQNFNNAEEGFTSFHMSLSSTVYCMDETGDYVEYGEFKSSEKRVWVDIDQIPQNLKDAFVAIEDQRFYEHEGVDYKRTFGAILNVFVKGDSSYGGSTITQQLIKNVTKDDERTIERKVKEITRALVLEKKMEKDEILEMYLNSIYLSQGVHGVEAAANVYFDKPVSELTLAECASIAGITQFPTTYDPIINPQNNKKKQLLVLSKMLELGFITEDEYNLAIAEELKIKDPSLTAEDTEEIQSYFTDYIFEQAKNDLIEEFGYTDVFAEYLLCNGGLKIYSTVDPEIQSKIEEYYANDNNFPNLGSKQRLESAIIVSDPKTGELKGIIGGRGIKSGNRVLNRATQSKRQPGSTIKPVGVYAPALEENIINMGTYIDNSKVTYPGNWTPANSNGKYTAPVSVKSAVAWSYNLPAVRVLEEVTVDKSFDYLRNKMHITSIVDSVTKNGKVYSDKNLSSLALGGLTDGVTPLEMSAAYCTLANGGMYIEPTSYTKICDKDGNVILEKRQKQNRVFSKETAFLMQQLMKDVVTKGTAAGSAIPGIETCGKTGTTDENKDKWFIGFTPYYCSTVWVGYDRPEVISTSANPAVTIWKNLMTDFHSDLSDAEFSKPKGIVKANICKHSGMKPSSGCGSFEYANEKFITGYCRGVHERIGTPGTYEEPKKTEPKKKESSETETNPTTPAPRPGGKEPALTDEKPSGGNDGGSRSEGADPSPAGQGDSSSGESSQT